MKNLAMIVFSHYPMDVRVRREAEALFEEGYSIDIFCIGFKDQAIKENINGIETYRVRIKRERSSKLNYFYQYLYFFLWSFYKISFHYFKKKYDVIHIHNMPDFLVFSAMIPRLFGAKIILDLHDPMPELYSTIFQINEDHWIIRHLQFLERASIKFAHHVLTPNISFKNLFISRGCEENKISIIMNSPDERIFSPDLIQKNKREDDNRFIIMYHGTIVERHGLDLAVKAVASLKDKIPGLTLWIYGEGNFLSEIERLIHDLNIKDIVETRGVVMVDKIAAIIPTIDLGIIPNRISSFIQINFPVRIFEYLVMNKPVIVPRTQGIRDYFGDDTIFYFDSDDILDLERKIFEVYYDKPKTEKILKKSLEVLSQNRWYKQKEKLIEIYKILIGTEKVETMTLKPD
jgi:glycosyltransferase involved in cell wall biosynthesis